MVSDQPKIPVTVIVATRNEEARIARCLAALKDFEEVIVADSVSTDRTKEIAAAVGARVEVFIWNGAYPKKRQWCLDHLNLKHDWVFFVDADEVVTPQLLREIKKLDFAASGYFVKGAYVMDGRVLQHGLKNNKLALLHRGRMEFPVVDDLGLPGMGEIEGHYQPVLKGPGWVGQLKAFLLHEACDDRSAWTTRHERYAAWERGMNQRQAWPGDPKRGRSMAKKIFRKLPGRGVIAFTHCYIVKLGFLDGSRGFRFAKSRYDYYRMIGSSSKAAAQDAGQSR
jgi:glycosyltransferase involved in cell wall biosynthesis